MTLTEWLTPRVELSFGGKNWRLFFPHEVLLEIEQTSGLSLLAGEFDPLHASAKSLRVVLHVLLRHAGASWSSAEVGRRIRLGDLSRIRNAIEAAWSASMPEPPKEPRPKDAGQSRKIRAWLQAWAIADQELQLTPDEWLAMTPRMVEALSRERLELLRENELMLSRIAAVSANFGFCRPQKPFDDTRFMSHPWPKFREVEGDIGDHIMEQMSKLRQ